MLKFRDCTVCHESHALRPNGLMSIHQTADGKRCEESPSVPAPVRERRDPKSRRRNDAPDVVDQEREEAFMVAAEKNRRGTTRTENSAKGRDRFIYATKGVHTVNGGSPGSGKR